MKNIFSFNYSSSKYVIWCSNDNHIYFKSWDQKESGSKKIRLTEHFPALPGSGVTAISRVVNHLDIFWINKDGALCSNWFNFASSDSRWNGGFEVTEKYVADKDSKIAAVGWEGQLAIFWSYDGSIFAKQWTIEHNWGTTIKLITNTLRKGSSVAAVARITGHIDLFWIDVEDAVRSTHWHNDKPFNTWIADYAITQKNMVAIDSDLFVIGAEETLDVFWACNNQIWTKKCEYKLKNEEGFWHESVCISKNQPISKGSTVSVISRFPGHLDVFWINEKKAISSNWWNKSRGNNNWNGDFTITDDNMVNPSYSLSVLGDFNEINICWIDKTELILTKQWYYMKSWFETQILPPSQLPFTNPLGQISVSNLINVKEIGDGCFGTVYRAEWHNRPIAHKKLKSWCQPKTLEESLAFKREAFLLAQLKHENIVKTYGICTEPEYGIIMEFIVNGSLYSLLHVGKEPPATKWDWLTRLDIFCGVGNGLAYLHTNGIYHRDLKSPNILIDEANTAKIADFGLAKMATLVENKHSGPTGPNEWMSPEMISAYKKAYEFKDTKFETFLNKSPEDYRTGDVYSYGVIMWEIATCKLPYGIEKNKEQAICHKTKIENVDEILQDSPCTKDVANIIEFCWKYRPKVEMIVEKIKALHTITFFKPSIENQKSSETTKLLAGQDDNFSQKPQKS